MTFEIIYRQNGILHTTELQAKNREHAIQSLKQDQNIQLIKIAPIQPKQNPLFVRPLRTKDLSIVFYQFAILLNAAIPLRNLLQSLANYPHPRIKAMFQQALKSVQNGQQLCDGFAPFRKELGIGLELIALGEKVVILYQFYCFLSNFCVPKNKIISAL